MFGRRLTKGFSLALSSFSVCGFLNANTTLSLKNFCGALVDNEAKRSWIIWFIRFFPDFVSLWVLEKIGFFKNNLFEKMDRLSLSAKKRMEARSYSYYVIDEEKYNFLLDNFDLFGSLDVVWDSYGYLNLRYPGFPGEKMGFYGYDLFGVFYKTSCRGEKWCWLTVDAKGEPIILMPSRAVNSDGETFEKKIVIDKDKIRERLPKIPISIIDAQPDNLK